MINVTDCLKEDHRLILRVIDALISFCQAPGSNGSRGQFAEKAKAFVDFIESYADRFHHLKEEELLFRELEAPGVLEHCNPLPQMLHEHRLGREFTAGMKQAIEQQNWDGFVASAADYAELLQQHIFKEDNVLYHMAETGLPEDAKQRLLTAYERADREHDVKALRQKFETWLSRC